MEKHLVNVLTDAKIPSPSKRALKGNSLKKEKKNSSDVLLYALRHELYNAVLPNLDCRYLTVANDFFSMRFDRDNSSFISKTS